MVVGQPYCWPTNKHFNESKGAAGNAAVTVAHSRTENLAELTRKADIVVMALGIPEYLTADMVKGAVIIDVGITRVTEKSSKKDTSSKEMLLSTKFQIKQVLLPQFNWCWSNDNCHVITKHLLARQWNRS